MSGTGRGAACTSMVVLSLLLSIGTGVLASDIMAGGSRADEPVVFLDVTNSSGLGWGSRNRVAWGDYDNDGWEDLLFRGASLWRNEGDGTFADVTDTAGISRSGSRGGLWGDYDNDGDLDIYQLHGSEGDDRLFRNDGGGVFTDVTAQAGEISDGGLPSEGAGWGDYDNDGYLDLYIANYEDPPNSSNGTYDVLYHNNGDGTFSNVTAQAGMLVEPQCGRGVSWGDYDDDGLLDIYVANYRLDRNVLWRNNGDGTFTDVAQDLGVEGDLIGGYYGHSIGAAWGDVDNDGDLDLFVANLAHPRFIVFSDISKLYLNSGPPDYAFQDVPIQTRGIAYEETHSDPSFADYDNDGDLDLFITSVYDGRPTLLYRNDGSGSFTDVTDEVGTVTDNGWGEGWSDYDNDGFLDLVVGSGNGTKFKLFKNGGNHNHWSRIDLRGTSSNTAGIGARVEVEHNGTVLVREVGAGRGTTSQDGAGAHFGLGDWDGTINITVTWPSGVLQRSELREVDQRIVLVEPPAATDFRFVSVDGPGDVVIEGEVVPINATIINEGTVTGGCDIELSVSGLGVVGSHHTDLGLAPFETRYIILEWDTSGAGGNRTVGLEAVSAQPEDSDPADNVWEKTVRVNMRPVATITTLDPPVAYQGRDMVTFKGQGSDDGRVVEGLWSSDLEGVLSTEMSFELEAGNLSTGFHTISFKVRDDLGAWSLEVMRGLTIEPPIPPKPPKARITKAEPDIVTEGDMVEFEGEGTDADGRVVGYRWESSIDGLLSEVWKFRTADLSPGDHVISFIVTDDDGLESSADTVDILVKKANTPPVAVIELIRPNPAEHGESVRFQGRGIDEEGAVDTFIWTSSIDGIISYDYDFSTDDMSEGTHTIGLRVRDSDGVWSEEVFEELVVLPSNDIPTVTVEGRRQRDDGSIKLWGTSDDPDGDVVVVEARLPGGLWVPAVQMRGSWDEWYYIIDKGDLPIGTHRVTVRSFDGKEYSDEVGIEVEVKEKDEGIIDSLWKQVNDALSGENMPCLVLIIAVVVVLVGLAALGARRMGGPTGEDIEKEFEARRRARRSDKGGGKRGRGRRKAGRRKGRRKKKG